VFQHDAFRQTLIQRLPEGLEIFFSYLTFRRQLLEGQALFSRLFQIELNALFPFFHANSFLFIT